MKQLIRFNPNFTPGTAGNGYLDFSGMSSFSFGRLYAVINATTNIPIYIARSEEHTSELQSH